MLFILSSGIEKYKCNRNICFNYKVTFLKYEYLPCKFYETLNLLEYLRFTSKHLSVDEALCIKTRTQQIIKL